MKNKLKIWTFDLMSADSEYYDYGAYLIIGYSAPLPTTIHNFMSLTISESKRIRDNVIMANLTTEEDLESYVKYEKFLEFLGDFDLSILEDNDMYLVSDDPNFTEERGGLIMDDNGKLLLVKRNK